MVALLNWRKKQIVEKKDKTPRTKKPKEVDSKKLGEAI